MSIMSLGWFVRFQCLVETVSQRSVMLFVRDRRCAITGQQAVNVRGEWTGFEAAHVFPLAHEGHWVANNYGCWITIQSAAGGSINSVQNGCY